MENPRLVFFENGRYDRLAVSEYLLVTFVPTRRRELRLFTYDCALEVTSQEMRMPQVYLTFIYEPSIKRACNHWTIVYSSATGAGYY